MLQARQPLPDQLRGLALLGIVFVNMPYLAVGNAGLSPGVIHSAADAVVAFLIMALAQGKFYLLFSFLFGYSLTLILRGHTADGLRRYRRRLLGLAVLGALHAVFFFVGDILLSYAVLGLALLWFDLRRTRTALIGAVVSYLLGVTLLLGVVLLAAGSPAGSGGFVEDAPALDAAIRGGFLEAAAGRLAALPGVLLILGVLNWAPALAMFLLGLAAGRAGVLARPDEYRWLWRRLLWLALLIGLPAGAYSAWLTLFAPDPSGLGQIVGVALGFASAPALTGGYVALAALLSHTRLLALAAPAGRMSLTGYLGESVLLSAIFAGWGLGLYGQLGLAFTAWITLGVWLALELFAGVWLRVWAHGPFEWLLRCWSNGHWTPLRRATSNGDRRPSRSAQ